MRTLSPAQQLIFVILLLLVSLSIVFVWNSDIRQAASANMRNISVIKHSSAQNTGCDLDPSRSQPASTSLQPEIVISADQFFSDANSLPYGSALFTLTERQNGVNTYASETLSGHYRYSDRQFRDLEKFSSSPVLSRNPLPSYAELLTDNSMVVTTVDLPVGNYQLQLYGNNDTPGPVTLIVRLNDTLLGSMTFDRDDESWEVKCLVTQPLYWSESNKNRAQISVTFIGDGGPGGSRDGLIAWLRLIPLSSF